MAEIHSAIGRRRGTPRTGAAGTGAAGTGAAGAVAALAFAAAALTGCGEAGATITRLTVGTPGPDPYAAASGTDKPGVRARTAAGTTTVTGKTVTGDSPGLYGGTRRASTCDRRRLIEALRADPAKARAWARAQGISERDIPAYVSGLTPVLLRTDTLVTNHGYRNGGPTGGPAVLQAGMGVLVNGRGVPTVKCNCGNPLTPPDKKISLKRASYTGQSWRGFEERNVTTIRPRDSKAVASFVLVDPGGTMGFERPRATAGEADGPPTAPPTGATASGSPSPGDSGTPSPGIGTPGTQSPGTQSPGTTSPGTGSPATGTPGTEPPDASGTPAGTGTPGTSPGSPGVTSGVPGTEGDGPSAGGDGTQSPVSPPPESPVPPGS